MAETLKIIDMPQRLLEGYPTAINETIQALADAGIVVHHKQDDLIATADASSLATSKTLTKALAEWIVAHAADTDVHTSADAAVVQAAAWASAPAEPADLTEVMATLNELKADINLHVAQADHHRGQAWGSVGGDGVVVAKAITTTDATDQPEANALANAIKAFCNNHAKAACRSVEITPN